jgi:secondary thiamine-phosphate synthase enzyme
MLKSKMAEFGVSTSRKNEIIDITDRVSSIVHESGIKEGICLVYAPHATAAILVLETDGLVEKDVLDSLSNMVPNNSVYAHSPGSGHGSAHVKSALFGCSKAVPVSKGVLNLGTWQSIALCELDGPRARKVIVEVVGR